NSAAPLLDPLLHLRLYGAGGALLADVAQPFGAAAGASLGTWLLGGPAFAPAPGPGADGAFPVALDPAGGRIELVAVLAGVPPVFEDSLAYGPLRPPPPDGFAFQRLAAFGAPTTIEPQPRNSAGQAVQIPGCAFAPPPPRYYLREVALECEDGGTLGQFVEIAWDHLADPLDARYHLRAFDRAGTQQFDIQRVLGWRTAGYMSVAGQFLVQSADYPLPPHLSPDGLLPAPLDTLAGRLELVFAGANGDSVASALAWGDAPLLRPLPGTSLVNDGVHVALAPEPNPVNYDGRSLRLPGCHFGGPPHGFVVGELVADCADGSTDGLFVELQSTAANEYRDPTLGLRVVSAAGAAVSAFPLFPIGQPSWPAGSRWLVGGSGFAARLGLAPDAALSAPVAAAGGRVEIFHRNPVTLADSVLAALPLAGVPLRSGHAYVRGPGGQYTIALPVMPQRFDGTQVAPPGCYAVPRGEAVAIAELMLRCRDGDAGGQFVRLVATDPDAVYAPELVLRALDARGALLGERTHLYGAVEGEPWRSGRSFLVGAPGLAASLGATPDATLPAALDTTGGTLELVLREPDGDRLVDSLTYGARGHAPPPAGGSLVRAGSAFAASALPTPAGLADSLAADAVCAGVCPPRQVRLALGSEQVLEQPSADI
ncbi:MAG TPA: hypothetical protein VGU27_01800, partial [Candidatus Eisenbacteria bacterium]|nr:hypothetical protein [Candidatus Eisenbacteria bacterium]